MNLTERLEELAESPAPPMEIDIARASRVGRRRRLRRRAGVVAGIAAVALAVAVAAAPVLNSAQPDDPASIEASEPAVLVSHATFGWLPKSLTRIDVGEGYHGRYTHAVDDRNPMTTNDKDMGAHLWLTVHPPGNLPKLTSFQGKQLTIAAPPVNGQTAYWVTETPSDPLNKGDAYLFWQLAGGAWVELHAYYLSSFDDPAAMLHRVASGVTVGDKPVPLPVRIVDMPAEHHIEEAIFDRPMRKDAGTGAWQLQLFYYAKEKPTFTISVHPKGSRKVTAENRADTCTAAEGIEVCIWGGPEANHAAIKALGGPAAVLNRFVPLGMDESAWVTG